jgi:hypothetical protein
MRRLDDTPMDPEIEAALDAIDATVAGEPVDPKYAELAELALLLTHDRPTPEPAFAHTLDERVRGRFGQAARLDRPAPAHRRGWLTFGGTSVALAAIVALLVFVAPGLHGAGTSSSSSSAASSALATESAGSSSSSAGSSSSSGAGSSAAHSPGSAAASSSSSLGSLSRSPQPATNGRKTVQSAQLNLVTTPNHVDDVAQEAFDVIGQQNGIVNRSTITQTGGADGNAFIQLSVPSSSLAQVMSKLSLLPNADVVSRTDNSQDVNNAFNTATRRLADARALHTSLLKQLAAAVTTEQVDSLHAQIRDNERAIGADEAGLARLNHRISFSAISLTINARTQPTGGGGHSSGGGFTLRKAAHDAGRVLVVVAGVALIALAVLIPVGLVVAFAWWIGALATHRRRERALDLA